MNLLRLKVWKILQFVLKQNKVNNLRIIKDGLIIYKEVKPFVSKFLNKKKLIKIKVLE